MKSTHTPASNGKYTHVHTLLLNLLCVRAARQNMHDYIIYTFGKYVSTCYILNIDPVASSECTATGCNYVVIYLLMVKLKFVTYLGFKLQIKAAMSWPC